MKSSYLQSIATTSHNLIKTYYTVLSQKKRGTFTKLNLKFNKFSFNYKIWALQLLAAVYYVSTIEKATCACFILCQDTRLDRRRWQVHLYFFLSSLKCLFEWIKTIFLICISLVKLMD